MNTNPEKDPPIDRFHRDEERQWERERVAPVGEPPNEEDLRRALAKSLPLRLAEIRKKLESAYANCSGTEADRIKAEHLVGAALHDIRNIENGVLALCECVNGKGASDDKATA